MEIADLVHQAEIDCLLPADDAGILDHAPVKGTLGEDIVPEPPGALVHNLSGIPPFFFEREGSTLPPYPSCSPI